MSADRRRAWRIRERQAPSPRAAEAVWRRYTRRLSDLAASEVDGELQAWRRERLPELARADSADERWSLTGQAADELSSRLRAALDRARARMQREPPPERQLEEAARAQARQAARAERQYLVRLGASPRRLAMRLEVPRDRLLGIDITHSVAELGQIRQAVQEGLDLILREPNRVAAGYADAITREVVQGRRWETVAKRLQARTGIEERHARLIARDQATKINGRITKATQTTANIDRYVWRATDDDRLRASHDEVDGRVWSWSAPPHGTGPYGEAAHPGEAPQCRCTAEPVIPSDLREVFGAGGPMPAVGANVPL